MTTLKKVFTRSKGPDRPFSHTDDCRILLADPDVEILWNEVEPGYWKAECQCGVEHFREPPADRRDRLDPLDPKNARHLGQCEYAAETDPAVLKLILRVADGLGDGYWWVTCSVCDNGWQVPHYPPAPDLRPRRPFNEPRGWSP